jgi:putative hydrolase of the HAD superfamily
LPPALVLFDLDGVLCRYDREARKRALAAMAGRTPEAVTAAIWESGFEEAADRGEYDAAGYLAEFGRRLGYPLTRAQWIANRQAALTPWPEMLALVRRVQRRTAAALLTTNGPLMLEALDEIYPALLPLFGRENLHFSCALGATKSQPEGFRRLLALRGLAAADCLFLDDHAEYVVTARQVGLEAVLFESPAQAKALLRERKAL